MDIPLPPSEPDSEGCAPDETPLPETDPLDHPVPTNLFLDDIPVPSLPPRDYPGESSTASSRLKAIGDPSQPAVLGKSAAKKRLLAFSKQSLVPLKKLKPDDKPAAPQEKPAFKKKKVKSEAMERAKETISEIEELKRLELREQQKLGRSGGLSADHKPSSSRGRGPLEADNGPSLDSLSDPMVSRKQPSVDNFVDEILMKKRAERVRRETDRSRRDSDRDRRRELEDREKRKSRESKLKDRDKDKSYKDDRKEKDREKKDKDKEKRDKDKDHHHHLKDKKEKLKKEDFDPKTWNELKLSEYSLSDLRRARRKLLKQMADSLEERPNGPHRVVSLFDAPPALKELISDTQGREYSSFTRKFTQATETSKSLCWNVNPSVDPPHTISREEFIDSLPSDILDIVCTFLDPDSLKRFDEKVIPFRKYCEVEDFLNPRAQRNNRALLSFDDEPDPGVWCVKSALVDEDYKELEVVLPPVSIIDELPLAESANPEPKSESGESPKAASLPPVETGDVKAAPQRSAAAEPLQDGLLAFEYEEFMKTIDPPVAEDDDVVQSDKLDPVEAANEEAWDRETPQLPPTEDIAQLPKKKKKKKSKKKESSEKKAKDPAKKKKKKRKRARSSSSSSSSSSSTNSSSSSSSSSSDESSDESSSSSSTSGGESKTKKRKKKSKQKLKAKKSKTKKKFDIKGKDKLKITESSPTSKSAKANKKSKKAEKTKRKKKKRRLSLECPDDFDLASLTKSTKTLEQSLVEQVTKIATLEKEYRKYEAASAKESATDKSCPFEGIGLLNNDIKDLSQESTSYVKDELREEVILGRNKNPDVPFTRHFNLDLFTEDVALTAAQANRLSPQANVTVSEEPLPSLDEILPPKDKQDESKDKQDEFKDKQDESKDKQDESKDKQDDPKGAVGEDFSANQESLDKSTELYSPTAEDDDDEFLDTGAGSSHIDDTSQLVSFGVNSASEEARMLDIPLPPPVQVEAPPTSFRNILQIPAPLTPSPTPTVSEPKSSEKESPAQVRTPIAKITFGKLSKLKPFKNVFSGDETDSEAESPLKMNEDKIPERSKLTKVRGKSKSPVDSKTSKRALAKTDSKGDCKMSDKLNKRPSTDEVIQRYTSEIEEFPLEKAADRERQRSSVVPGITRLKSESKGNKTDQGERNGKGQQGEDAPRMSEIKEAIGVNNFHSRHRHKRSRSRDRKHDDRRRRGGRRSASPDRDRMGKRRRSSPRERRRRSRDRRRRDRPRSGSGKRRSMTPGQEQPAQDHQRQPSKTRETTPIRNSHSREPSLIKTFKEETEFNFDDVVVKEEVLTSDGGGEADSKNDNTAEVRTVTYNPNELASEAIEPPRETGFSDWESPVQDRRFDGAEMAPQTSPDWHNRGQSPTHFRYHRGDNVLPHGSPEFRVRPGPAYLRPESPQRPDYKRSLSPVRKGSFDSNRRSPGPRRKSPGSPVQRDSGPSGRRRDHSRSPKWRGRNVSPMRDRGLPRRPSIDRSKRSHSPLRRKPSVSPRRSMMRSPPRRGPVSPLRLPPSPLRKGPSRSPMRRGPSHSPLRRGPSRSPVRRGPKHSPRYPMESSYSPVRRGPHSPLRLRKDSPGRRGPSLSPRRGRSPSPLTRSRLMSHRRFNDSPPAPFYSPLSEKHRSPPRNRSPPPSRRLDASPFRRRSPVMRSPRSPRHSPRRRRSPTPNRHSPGRRRRSISPYRERNMSPPDRLRRPSPGWSSRGRSHSHSPGMKHPPSSPFRVRYSPLPSPNRRQGSTDRRRSSERRRGTPPRFDRSPRRRSYSPSPARDRDRPSKWSWNEDSTDKFAARNLSEWDDYPRPPPPVGADYQSNQPDSTISDSELVREMTSSPKRLSLDQRIQLELGDILGNSTSEGPYGNSFYNQPPGQDHVHQLHHPYGYPPPGFSEAPAQNLIYPPIHSGAEWSAVPPPPPPAAPPTNTLVQVGNILQVVPSEVPYDVKPPHSKKSKKGVRPPTPTLPLPDEHENESVMGIPMELAGTGSPVPGTSGVKLHGLSPVESPVLKHKLPLPPEHTSPSLPDPIVAKQEDRERRRREKEARKKKKEEKAAKRMLRKAMLKKRAALLPFDDVPSSPVPRVFITENTTGMTLPTADKGILLGMSAGGGGGDAKRKMVSFADGIRPGEGTSPSGGEDHPMSPPPRPRKTKKKKKKKKRKVKVRIVRLGRNGEDEEEDDGEPPPPPPSPAPPIAYIDIANLPPGYGFVELSSLGDDPMLLQQFALPPPPPPAVR